MRVLLGLFLAVAVVGCAGAPGTSVEDSKHNLLSVVAIENNVSDEENINVKFEHGELVDAARAFNEARGKVKKYTPLLTSITVKIMVAIVAFFTGALMFLAKYLILTKIAIIIASVMGFHRLLNGNNLSNILDFQSVHQDLSSLSAAPGSLYNFGRSKINQNGIDLAYNSQIPS